MFGGRLFSSVMRMLLWIKLMFLHLGFHPRHLLKKHVSWQWEFPEYVGNRCLISQLTMIQEPGIYGAITAFVPCSNEQDKTDLQGHDLWTQKDWQVYTGDRMVINIYRVFPYKCYKFTADNFQHCNSFSRHNRHNLFFFQFVVSPEAGGTTSSM